MIEVFVAQYISILLLGIQSLNVRDEKYLASAITSLLLGVSGWYVTGVVASAFSQGLNSSTFYAFLLAGPCGITSSGALYKRMTRSKHNDNNSIE